MNSPDQAQIAHDLAVQFRRLRCRANELVTQLGVMCDRTPDHEELRSLAGDLIPPRRCDLITCCVNLEVSLQEAQKWSGRVLAAVTEAHTRVTTSPNAVETVPSGGEE